MVNLLLIIGVILLILWIIGLTTRRTYGGLLHAFLVIALILIVIWLLRYVGVFNF